MKMTKHEIIFCVCFLIYIMIMGILDSVYSGKPFWYGVIWGVGFVVTGIIAIALADFITKKWGE